MKFIDKRKGIRSMERVLSVHSEYLGPPTFAYRVGEFLVDRDGNVRCEDGPKLAELERRLADEGVGGEGIPRNEGGRLSTPHEMRNLVNMVHSKQYLIGRAVGYKAFEVTEELVDILSDKTLTAEEMVRRIKAHAPVGLAISDDGVSITGLPDTDSYRRLAEAMMEAASLANWVQADETIEENEKYYMRAWLVRIGMGGASDKRARNVILKNLKGHTAFRTEEAARKWKEQFQGAKKVNNEDTDH